MADSKWKPIEPLSARDRGIDLAEIQPLYEPWRMAQNRLEEKSAESFRYYKEKVIRRLSVETGILERLYELDRGTTEALVANGFAEELVSHSSSNIEPVRLIDFLKDQQAAIELVIDCVAENRPLTKSVVHELHQSLTRHQDTTSAIDPFGRRFEVPLLKGRFKQQPNNLRRPDGSIHEYCPPLHVESEMDNLLGWLADYTNEDPIVVAAWLHHRLTQIHPYQDGNGRVARALTTLVLLRFRLLPLVIDRDLRQEYLRALEGADAGDLASLVSLFARLERTTILEALSVDVDAEMAHQPTLTSAVINSLAARFNRRRQAQDASLRQVNRVAKELRSLSLGVIEETFGELEAAVSTIEQVSIQTTEGGPDHDNAHFYKHQVVQSVKDAGRYVNFDEEHYFAKAAIRSGAERLVFVVSLHHVGRMLSGIMEATAFAQLESYKDPQDRDFISQEFFPSSLEPFVFTDKSNVAQIEAAFQRWLDSALAVAIKEYGDRL